MPHLAVSSILAAVALSRFSSGNVDESCDGSQRTDSDDESSMLQGRPVYSEDESSMLQGRPMSRVSISATGAAEGDEQVHATTASDVLAAVQGLTEEFQAAEGDTHNITQMAEEYASILETVVIPSIEGSMGEMKTLLATQRTFVKQCNERMQHGWEASAPLQLAFVEQRSVYNACVEVEGQIAQNFTACHKGGAAGETQVGLSSCSDLKEAYIAKVTECEGVRTTVDAAACAHASHNQAVCQAYKDCRSSSMAVYQEAAKSAKRRADNHRTQFFEAKQAQCIARGLAPSGGDKKHVAQLLKRCTDLPPSTDDDVADSDDAGDVPPSLVCQDVAARPCLDGRVGLDIGEPSMWNAPCQACPAMSKIAPAVEVQKSWRANAIEFLSTAASFAKKAADPRRRSASAPSLLGVGGQARAGTETSSSGEIFAFILAIPLAAMGVALCVAIAFVANRQPGHRLNDGVHKDTHSSRGVSASRNPPGPKTAGPTAGSVLASRTSFGSADRPSIGGPGLPSRTSFGSMDRPSVGGRMSFPRRQDPFNQSPPLGNHTSGQLSPMNHGLDSPKLSARSPFGLCPELVVPEGSECILGIPSIAGEKSGEVSLKNITDKVGQPLLFVGLTSAPSGGEYILLTKQDQQELAFCELTSTTQAGGWCGKIFRWDGELFARMREERSLPSKPTLSRCNSDMSQASAFGQPVGPVFVVSSAAGSPWELRITGSIRDRRMTVENGSRDVVAMVSPGEELAIGRPQGVRGRVDGESYKLRLASEVDTCTIIVAFLAIERILSQQGR